MAVSPQRGFAADRHRALRFLAAAPNGATEAIMLAHGFTNVMLDALVRDGLATADRASNAGGAAADRGDVADDHRRRAAGACWVIPAIDCIDRLRIAPGRGWARRSGERASRPGEVSGASAGLPAACVFGGGHRDRYGFNSR
jgi:hypothetical protein